jgi:hypothetical protein
MAEEQRSQSPLNNTAAAGFLSNNSKKTVTNQTKKKLSYVKHWLFCFVVIS